MPKLLRVLMVEPHKAPFEMTVADQLDDLQETVARVRAQAVSLFISCIMDVGDVEWTRVCLMIPRDEEMCAVFYDGATQ